MSILNWFQAGEIVALGWTLLHFCWQSAAVALVYVVLDRCLVRASTAVRYGLAMGLVALLPVIAVATFVEQEHLVVHFAQDDQPVVASQLGALHVTVAKDVPFAEPAVTNSELWIAGHADRLMPWIDGLWLAGVCLLALRAAGGWLALQRLRRNARAAVPLVVEASFARVVAELRLAHAVMLRVSEEVLSPMAMGVWRASVILPLSAVTLLPAEQLEAVLAHELAHIRRWDYICNLLQTAIECLFFFHPAVWWISRRTRELREMCCDEVAARMCVNPGVYAEALLQLEEQRAEHLQLAVALHGNGGSLLNRIRRVMGERTMEYRSMSGVRMAVAGLVVAGLALAPHMASALKAEPAHARILAGEQAVAPVLPEPAPVALQVEPRVHVDPQPVATIADVEAQPYAAPAVVAAPVPAAAPMPVPMPRAREMQDETHTSGSDYLQKMRDAGYPLDLNKDLDTIISLRSVGVTPEYAKAMAQVGLGTPSLRDLISLRAQGVTPEYIAGLKNSKAAPENFHDVVSEKALGVTSEYANSMAGLGLGTPSPHDLISLKAQGVTPEYAASLKNSKIAPANLHELISEKALGVTPEYADAMAGVGLGTPNPHDLMSLKAQGVTPEYVAQLKASGIAPADLRELASLRAVGVTPEYAKSMAAAGLPSLSTRELISLRAQGVTPEYAHWMRTTFPEADMRAIHQAAVFHIDADFVSKAKAHGFNGTDLEKLVRLKMAGLLN